MTKKSCPNHDELSLFNSGILEEAAAEDIARHLDECLRCCNTLAGLNSGFPTQISERSKHAYALRHSTEPEYRLLEARLRKFELRHETPRQTGSETLSEGSLIGPYRIENCLGEGGMGVVYKALHIHLEQSVALKVLPSLHRSNASFRNRFVREMKAIGRISHPSIVRGVDAGEHDGWLYLAMEFIDGITLADLQRIVGTFAVSTACDIMQQVALALDSVHAQGMLHRDIKPSNLMLTDDDRGQPVIKILDLGLAKLTDGEAELSEMTSVGQILGTLEYMAPEQADNSADVHVQSDVYSIGATLYKLLTGNAPYAADRFSSPLKMLSAIATSDPVPIADRVDVSDQLAALVDAMLARKIADRPRTAGEVAESLGVHAERKELKQLLSVSRASPQQSRPPLDALVQENSKAMAVVPKRTPRNTAVPPGNRLRVPASWFILLTVIAFLAAGTVWLKTDGGYLRIESPPGIAPTVEILQDGKFLESIEVERSIDAIWFRAGSYEIRLPAAESQKLTLTNNRFTLQYRNHHAVTITRLPDTATQSPRESALRDGPPKAIVRDQQPSTPASPSRDRTTQALPEQPLNGQATDSPLSIQPNSHKVTLSPIENVDLKFVRWFWKNCKGFLYVKLPEHDEPKGYITVREPPTFEIEVDAATVSTVADRYIEVVGFVLGRNRPVTNEFVADLPIEDLQSLEFIHFDGQINLTLRAYEHLLRKKPDLRGLSDIHGPFGSLLPIVRRFSQLQSFRFSGRRELDWYRELSQIKTLTKIHAYHGGLTPKAIQHLASLPKLTKLIIESDRYRHAWVDELVQLRSLTSLRLPDQHGQEFTHDILMRFAELQGLETLSLGGEAPRKAVIELQRRMPKCVITFSDESVASQIPPLPARRRLSPTEAEKAQLDWSEFLGAPVEKSVMLPGGEQMRMVLVPPGEFLMGSSGKDLAVFQMQSEEYKDDWGLDRLPHEHPQHLVQITQPFYLSKYEMTRAQWSAVTGSDPTNPSYRRGDADVMPVRRISWEDTQAMVEVLNDTKHPELPDFRLPTEAQWEYACRAGTPSAFHHGDLAEAIDSNGFWHGSNVSRKQQPVGTSIPNAWGLFDMHGNVHEWVQDRAELRYPSNLPVTDPTGPSERSGFNNHRIFRGGSCWDPPSACRSALRGHRPSDYVFHSLGLRLSMSAKSSAENDD